TMINFLGPNRYQVMNPNDLDGDGVTDGKSLSGDDGKVVNEGAINQMLSSRGLKAVSGNFQSVDGFSLSSTNTSAVTSFGGAPSLPDVTGATASAGSVGDKVHWLDVTQGLDDAALMWMALSTMAHTSMRDIKDAKMLKHAMQKAKVDAKRNEIKATEEKIEAERKAAVSQFIWSVAASVASFAVGALGASEGMASSPAGAGLQAMGGSLGGAVTSFGNMQSKAYGAQAEADDKQIEAMRWQQQQEIMDMAIEDAKSNYEEARELFKLALKIMSEHVERQSQVVQTITRG
ncbi:MAG: hypothetical protein V3T05_04505, partial [Myxococcota bacterium]